MKIKHDIIIAVFVLVMPVKLRSLDWQNTGISRVSNNDYRSSLFNPGNFCVRHLGLKNAGMYFSQYLGLSDCLLTCNWRLDLLGKSSYNGDWQHSLKITQFYVQRDIFENCDLMLGRTLLNWGTGYAFNPTDVVAPQKELSDPENKEKQATGTDLAKLEYFGETCSAALCYLPQLEFNKILNKQDCRFAFRLYQQIGRFDLAIIALWNRDESPIFASNFSYVTGKRLEIHGEIARQKHSYHLYHKAITGGCRFYDKNPFAMLKKDKNCLFIQCLFGFQYTLPGNINWILEYFHQDQGYSINEWEKIIDYVQFLNNNLQSPSRQVAQGNLLWCLNAFSPKGALQDYLMNYLGIPIFNQLEFKSTMLINVNDHSYIFIPEINFLAGKCFTFNARCHIFQGERNSEFGELIQSHLIQVGLRIEP